MKVAVVLIPGLLGRRIYRRSVRALCRANSATVLELEAKRRNIVARLTNSDLAVTSVDQADQRRRWDVVIDWAGVIAAIQHPLAGVARGGTYRQLSTAAFRSTTTPLRLRASARGTG